MDEIEEENRRRSFFYGRKRNPRLQFYGRRYFPHQSPLSVLIGRKKDSKIPGIPYCPRNEYFSPVENRIVIDHGCVPHALDLFTLVRARETHGLPNVANHFLDTCANTPIASHRIGSRSFPLSRQLLLHCTED